MKVQVSGTLRQPGKHETSGSGGIIRPKEGETPARVSRTLVPAAIWRDGFAAYHRQLFLTEQGYNYEILDESDLAMLDVVRQGATG